MQKDRIQSYYQRILLFITEYSTNNISAHSAQVAFFIMVSIFPMLLFILTIIRLTPLTEEMLLTEIGSIIPSALSGLFEQWTSELFVSSSGTLISISVISTLWAGSKGFLGIISGLQKIYNVEKTRNYFQNRVLAVLYTISFTVIIILSMFILVFGNQIFLIIEEHFFSNNSVFTSLFLLRALFGLILFTIFFTMLYTFVPNKKLKIRHQIKGAFIASVIWIGFSYIYSVYIDYFSNPSSLYGSLANIVLFMLWLYGCTNILFIGGLLNNTKIFKNDTDAPT
jgi:membrane protein